jgi:hypothetical protein
MKLSQGVIDVSQGVIEAVARPVRSGLFAIASARKAKWIVAGSWLAAFLGSFALDLPGRFADAEQNETSTTCRRAPSPPRRSASPSGSTTATWRRRSSSTTATAA